MRLQEYKHAAIANVATVAVLLGAFVVLSLPLISNAQTENSNTDLLDAIREIISESVGELAAKIDILQSEVKTLRAEVGRVQGGGSSGPGPSGPTLPPQAPQIEIPGNVLGLGDRGIEVQKLQKALIHLGFEISAGATGNYLFQTQTALRHLQEKHGLSPTGVLNEETRDLLARLVFSPSDKKPFVEDGEELIFPAQEDEGHVSDQKQPPVAPDIQVALRLLTPYDKMLFSIGGKLPIQWSASAPNGVRLVFGVRNKLSGAERHVHATTELAGSHDWTIPNDMPGENEFTSELIWDDENGSHTLASKTIVFTILGGEVKETTTSSGTGSDSAFRSCFQSSLADAGVSSAVAAEVVELRAKPWAEISATMQNMHNARVAGSACDQIAHTEEFDGSGNRTWNPDVDAFQACLVEATEGFDGRSGEVNAVFMDLHFPSCDALNTDYRMPDYSDNSYDADFYEGAEFTSCMADYPETISLIHSWIDDGMYRDQFPWGTITGSAANKVAECEGGTFYDANIPYYGDCREQTSESVCYAQPGCAWYGSYCDGDNAGGGTSAMYSCFYPNATINGNPPGYTVWCEHDYQNCHEGDPSGASVSLDGLSLGAPSTCESGYYGNSYSSCSGTTESTCTVESNCYWNAESAYCYYDMDGDPTTARPSPFLANVFTAFSEVLQNFKKAFGF